MFLTLAEIAFSVEVQENRFGNLLVAQKKFNSKAK